MKIFGRGKTKKLEEQLAFAAAERYALEQENERMKDEQRRLRRKEQENLERQRQQEDRIQREHEANERQLRREEERQRAEQERQRAERKARERVERQVQASEARRREKLAKTTPESLRKLRDLIRRKYQLDGDIWSMRHVRKADQKLVYDLMEQADSTLLEIYEIVGAWEENANMWQSSEWKQAQNIKEKILEDGKKMWGGTPPWNEA